jgi:hypothetical protein
MFKRITLAGRPAPAAPAQPLPPPPAPPPEPTPPSEPAPPLEPAPPAEENQRPYVGIAAKRRTDGVVYYAFVTNGQPRRDVLASELAATHGKLVADFEENHAYLRYYRRRRIFLARRDIVIHYL